MKYSKELLLSIYKQMKRIRLCEEALVQPIEDKQIKTPCHLCSGQEAIAVGVCVALEKEDYVFGNHRSHGHFLAKGGDIKTLIAEMFCKQTGCSRGRGGSMHLIDVDNGFLGSAPIVSGTISLATGSALASRIRGDKRVSVSFFGDGAVGEGVLYESLNFAALKKLPIIFVCENNFYATHMPIDECRQNRDICTIAKPFGIKTAQIDGNSIFEVYEKARLAIDYCRDGEGPFFLECLTYRQRGHVGPNDNIQGFKTDIRPKKEIKEWLSKDPIEKFRENLLEEKRIAESSLERIDKQIKEEIKEAFLFAHKSQVPDKNEVLRYVYK